MSLWLGGVDAAARKVRSAAQGATPYVFDSRTNLQSVFKHVPYASGLVKLHKKPIKFRFLDCSKKNGLRKMARWLTALLRNLHGDLAGVWKDLIVVLARELG